MCTGIKLIAQNNAVVYARTLEFGMDLESAIIVIPRKCPYQGTTKSGNQNGLTWQSKYAVVGANAYNMPILLDGVNEQGLAGGIFYFPDYAQFQEVTENETSISVAPWELLTWMLTNFATVQEVAAALPTIRVCNAIFGPWGSIPPMHYIIHDKAGNSLVIEYRNGTLHTYNNPLGVFTNAPSFDWHITNLNNYINLSASNITKTQLGSISLSSFGQGSGMLGLPGDFTPPSRFVRAAFFVANVAPINNEFEAWFEAFHILQLFNIPKGIVRKQEKNEMVYDCTLWTSASDLKNSRYYFHTYDNPTVRKIDLMSFDFESKKIMSFSMKSPYTIESLTHIT